MGDEQRRDRLFVAREPGRGEFEFDADVAAVFADMIGRSVPGYAMIVDNISLLAARYAQAGSLLLDLGCSLGASTVALASGAAGRGCRVVGVDNAQPMLDRAAAHTQADFPSIEWRCADVRDVIIEDASIIVLNFTLQFLPIEDRLPMLRQVYAGLRRGGILILSEKIAAPDSRGDTLLTDMHHAFKQRNGYSELEISRKRNALENVLVPETVERHRERIIDAGFRHCDPWFQAFNFVSLLASK